MTVILTGAINSGKTTLLSGLAAALRSAGGRPRGLLTLKRFDGERRVYTALDLATGRRRKLLEVEAGVRTEARGGFAFAAAALSRRGRGPVFIDEFGVLELAGGGFRAEADRIISGGGDAVVVVREGILSDVRRLPGLRGARVVRLKPGRGEAAAACILKILDGART